MIKLLKSYWKVKHEIKEQERGFVATLLTLLAASLVEPVTSFVVKSVTERGIERAGPCSNLDKRFYFCYIM